MSNNNTTVTTTTTVSDDKISYSQAREEIKAMSIVEEVGITTKALIALTSMATTQLYRGTRNWEF